MEYHFSLTRFARQTLAHLASRFADQSLVALVSRLTFVPRQAYRCINLPASLAKHKSTQLRCVLLVCAEAVRFELTVPFDTLVFKTSAIDHSATPPICNCLHSIAEKALFFNQLQQSTPHFTKKNMLPYIQMPHRPPKISHYFLQDIDPVVRILIISDTVFMGAVGLLGPIFALFVDGFITGSNEAVIGLAAGIFLFTKSIFQIPVAHIIDKIKGEKDDYWLLVVSTLIISVLPLAYLFISTPLELYAVQFLLGIFTACTFPTFMALFTRHIDKNKEGTEWGVYYTLTDLTGAALAMVGGYLAVQYGFQTLIIAVVTLSTMGALLLLPLRSYIRK